MKHSIGTLLFFKDDWPGSPYWLVISDKYAVMLSDGGFLIANTIFPLGWEPV